jgi:paraquat-inducible protein B
VRKSKPISMIWLIPIVAAVAGGFLAWKAISEEGPTITILFNDAEGLQVEKTKVKYKDVEIGVVEAIEFTEDLSQVKVTASLTKQAAPYLTDKTRFWVVRAQVSAGQVTGLGTLLGGAYIGVDLSDKGRRQKQFVGLATAPIVTSEDEGSFYTLRAESLGSLGVGAPVYYRSLKVGQVVAYQMDDSGDFFTLQIFVNAPHDQRIDTQTRFWNASGFDAVVDAEGIRVDTPSLVSMLIGGISFDNFDRLSEGQPVTEETVFTLYENKADTLSPRYRKKIRFVVFFDRSVGGLAAGAPVEFRGIKIGEVVDLTLTYDFDKNELQIPVVIEIEPERLKPVGENRPDYSGRGMEQLVKQGLRARLATGNLLTGQLKVDLAFIENAEPAEIVYGGTYPELPTAPDTLDQIANSLANTMAKVDAIPIDEIGRKLDGVLGELHGVTTQINRDIAPVLTASLASLEETLHSVDDVVGPDSAIKLELEALLIDLSDTARSTRLLTERLEQYPEDLLRGKSR